jgi:outer membrane protein assembly factor BamA
VEPLFEGINPAALPPVNRMSSDLVSLLHNAFYGLPRDTTYPSQTYRPKLGLDYIAQPTLAFGADRFGTFIGGGVSLFWSDVLGSHNLATGLSINGSFKDISGLLGYSNRTRRLNWAVSAQQIPFRTGFISRGFLVDSAQNVIGLREDFILFRQINRQVGGAVAYPISSVQRVEFSAQYMGISFDLERQTSLYRLDGALVSRTRQNIETRPPLHLGQANVALVYDNSLFGLTSPMMGQRYRFELGSNVGSLNYRTVLADYRKYVMVKRPFTLAGRILHFGRYGPDGDNQRILSPLYLGFEGFLRGYRFGSFDLLRECPPNQISCPAFEELFGSKVLVTNAELRFPLLGVLGIGSGLFGFLPIEMVFFGDAGLAWWNRSLPSDISQYTPEEQASIEQQLDAARPFFLGGTRQPMVSAGVALRMNVFGVAIISLNYVRPFNRPRKGAHFQFTFTPGF